MMLRFDLKFKTIVLSPVADRVGRSYAGVWRTANVNKWLTLRGWPLAESHIS